MLRLDAEALYQSLLLGVRGLVAARDSAQPLVLVGIWRGGAWLAERLQRDLALPGTHGVISSTLHRDDFSARGLAGQSGNTGATQLPFAIEGAHILLIDDVLHTGRTIRAVINELYDFGRPASVALAVLVDRGGLELPVAAAFAAARISLPRTQRLSLARQDGAAGSATGGPFSFSVREVA
jgi:pyrimidine operon attenuation protein / uracil phosphoribosyltransferase